MMRRYAGHRREPYAKRWGQGGKLGGHHGATWADTVPRGSSAAGKRIGRRFALRRVNGPRCWARMFMTRTCRRQHFQRQAAQDRTAARQCTAQREREKAERILVIDAPAEFIELCKRDGVEPSTVLRGFIADLCGIMNWQSDPREDGYSSNGSDERDMAEAYYERCGYSWLFRSAA